MKRIFAAAVIVACLAPAGAQAGDVQTNEKIGGVAAGAVAGALVGGPIGAIIGAAIGYGASSAIAHRNGTPAARAAATQPPPASATPRRESAQQPSDQIALKPVPLPRARPSAAAREARAELTPSSVTAAMRIAPAPPTPTPPTPPARPAPANDARAIPH